MGLLFTSRHPECLLFFFQAEDGIRDVTVTGVQTCALPILRRGLSPWNRSHIRRRRLRAQIRSDAVAAHTHTTAPPSLRTTIRVPCQRRVSPLDFRCYASPSVWCPPAAGLVRLDKRSRLGRRGNLLDPHKR